MIKDKICASLEEINQQELIDLCKDLIQTPSYIGEEKEIAQLLVDNMLKLGFDNAWIDGVGNVIGEIKGSKPGPKILFDGHIDTISVSGSEVWKVDPFEGLVQDGRIFGRGAAGMKGALSAMAHGLAPLAKYKDRLAGTIFMSGTIGKEQFTGVAFAQVVKVLKPDYVIIGEPSNLHIKYGQRGCAELSISTWGKAAHSAHAQAGKNAASEMMLLLNELSNMSLPQQESLGNGSLEMTNIISAPYPSNSTIPHRCWASFDRYLVQGETEEEILAPIQAAIKRLEEKHDNFKGEVKIVEAGLECYTGQYLFGKNFCPAWLLPIEHELVSGAKTALQKIGIEANLSTYDMCTNGSYSAGIAGIPTIGFGPGCESSTHAADENIEIVQLNIAAAGYQAIACNFLLDK